MTDDIQYHTVSKQAIRLSLITDSYMDCIASLKKHKDVDDWNMLLSGLPDLILDKDYVLNDFRPREETNSVLRLYARNRYLPHSIYVLFENFFKPLSFFCKKRSRLLQQKRRCCYSSDVAKLMFSS